MGHQQYKSWRLKFIYQDWETHQENYQKCETDYHGYHLRDSEMDHQRHTLKMWNEPWINQGSKWNLWNGFSQHITWRLWNGLARTPDDFEMDHWGNHVKWISSYKHCLKTVKRITKHTTHHPCQKNWKLWKAVPRGQQLISTIFLIWNSICNISLFVGLPYTHVAVKHPISYMRELTYYCSLMWNENVNYCSPLKFHSLSNQLTVCLAQCSS